MMSKRMNGMYEIIASYRVDEELEIVIGRGQYFYECWYCHNGNDYDTGTDSPYLKDILKEFNKRVMLHEEHKRLS